MRWKYRGTQYRRYHRPTGDACNNKAGPALGVFTDPSYAQCDDGWEAYALEEESQAQHRDPGVLFLSGGCGVEDDDAREISEKDPSDRTRSALRHTGFLNHMGARRFVSCQRRKRRGEDGDSRNAPRLDEFHQERTAEATDSETTLSNGEIDGTRRRGCAFAGFGCVIDEVACDCNYTTDTSASTPKSRQDSRHESGGGKSGAKVSSCSTRPCVQIGLHESHSLCAPV